MSVCLGDGGVVKAPTYSVSVHGANGNLLLKLRGLPNSGEANRSAFERVWTGALGTTSVVSVRTAKRGAEQIAHRYLKVAPRVVASTQYGPDGEIRRQQWVRQPSLARPHERAWSTEPPIETIPTL